MVRVAINGFGRIGRMILKAGINDPDIEWVAVNDLTDTKTLADLFKYDSVYGKFNGDVEALDNALRINSKEVKVFAERDPSKLPWGELKIDVVVESTGLFRTREKAQLHIQAGAKKVLLSAPGKDEIDFTIVKGVNDDKRSNKHVIISNASCTTNCLAPMVKVLNDHFKVRRGFLTTVHSYTADQNIVDGPHKDLRRARAAALNIIPTTTGAAKAVALAIPELAGKLDGISLRVPTACGSYTDFVCEVDKPVTVDQINNVFKEAAFNGLKGILEYSDEPLVSRDIVQNPHSCIFDSGMTRVVDRTLVKVGGWYDNEWGYSCRMVDVLKLL